MTHFIFSMLLVTSILMGGRAWALVCDTSLAPSCPTSGVKILDESFPTGALVISHAPQLQSQSSINYPRKTITQFLKAYDFKTAETPTVLVPTEKVHFDALITSLKQDLIKSGLAPQAAQQLLSEKVIHVEAKSQTWQQDYFEATFDPQTGKPKLNFSTVYEFRDESPFVKMKLDSRKTFNSLASTGVCDIEPGADLKTKVVNPAGSSSLFSGTMESEFGGNMEGLPGGLCLVGSNMKEDFAVEGVCGNAGNIVRANVDWLQIGHVDEIFKALPVANTDARPRECAFSILAADTEVGLEVLKDAEFLAKPMLQLEVDEKILYMNSAPFDFQWDPSMEKSFNSNPALKILCKALREKVPTKGTLKSPKGKSASLSWFLPLAHASEVAPTPEDIAALNCVQNHQEVSTALFLEGLEKQVNLLAFNRKVQKNLLKSRLVIYEGILKRLPQCRKYFPSPKDMFTPVPNLFSPLQMSALENLEVERDEISFKSGVVYSSGYSAVSLFPNPTNSLLANTSLLLPGPLPKSYQKYLSSTLKGKGLQPVMLDSWDYAHVGFGNVHCSTHSVPYCRPSP